MTAPPLFFKYDAWLTSIIGKTCYHLKNDDFLKSPSPLSELDQESYFVDTKVDCSEVENLITLQSMGFKVIDTNVTFSLGQDRVQSIEQKDYIIREAEVDDEHSIGECASSNFIYTRYHLDPNISIEVANKIKSDWARNFFKGKRGDKMIVACTLSGELAGFCQILEPDIETRVIDLIAVDKNHRRQKLAQSMITYALRHTKEILVGTQVSNIPSIRCYESMGFKLKKSNYVLHYHN